MGYSGNFKQTRFFVRIYSPELRCTEVETGLQFEDMNVASRKTADTLLKLEGYPMHKIFMRDNNGKVTDVTPDYGYIVG